MLFRSGSQGFEKGLIITKINDNSFTDAKEAAEMLDSSKGRIKINGIYPDGTQVIVQF